MIELYSWATPESHQVHILLEECGLPYRTHPVDADVTVPRQPELLAISTGGQVPVIVDPRGPDGEPISLCGCGAILVYLAVKAARFLPADARGRYEVLQWLMLQVAHPGALPSLPQAVVQARQWCGVLDQRLGQSGYIGGAEYSIADIAVYAWLRSWQCQGIDWADDHPRLRAWFDDIGARPAVQRGCAVPADLNGPPPRLTAA